MSTKARRNLSVFPPSALVSGACQGPHCGNDRLCPKAVRLWGKCISIFDIRSWEHIKISGGCFRGDGWQQIVVCCCCWLLSVLLLLRLVTVRYWSVPCSPLYPYCRTLPITSIYILLIYITFTVEIRRQRPPRRPPRVEENRGSLVHSAKFCVSAAIEGFPRPVCMWMSVPLWLSAPGHSSSFDVWRKLGLSQTAYYSRYVDRVSERRDFLLVWALLFRSVRVCLYVLMCVCTQERSQDNPPERGGLRRGIFVCPAFHPRNWLWERNVGDCRQKLISCRTKVPLGRPPQFSVGESPQTELKSGRGNLRGLPTTSVADSSLFDRGNCGFGKGCDTTRHKKRIF